MHLKAFQLYDGNDQDFDATVYTFSVNEEIFNQKLLQGQSLYIYDKLALWDKNSIEWKTVEIESALYGSGSGNAGYRTTFTTGYDSVLYIPRQKYYYEDFVINSQIVAHYTGSNINNQPHVQLTFADNGYLPTTVTATYTYNVIGVNKDTGLLERRSFVDYGSLSVDPSWGTTQFGLRTADLARMYVELREVFKGDSFYIQDYAFEISTNGIMPIAPDSSYGTKVTKIQHYTGIYNFGDVYYNYIDNITDIERSHSIVSFSEITKFVGYSVANIFGLELFPGFYLGGVLAIIVTISVMILIIKFFAGG